MSASATRRPLHRRVRARRAAGVRGGAPNPIGPELGRDLSQDVVQESARAVKAREALGATAPRETHRPPGGTRLTLGDLVAGAWEGLVAAGSAVCPICCGRLELERGEGVCRNCGARMS